MVRFECPNCRERLEVDSGFRGSVARCDKCGALIHVPVKRGRRAQAPAKRPKHPSPLSPGAPSAAPIARAATRQSSATWIFAAFLAAGLVAIALAAAWFAGVRP